MFQNYIQRSFIESFNSIPDSIRIFAILSPTCPACLRGFEIVKRLFQRFESEKLKGFIIWTRKLEQDNGEIVETRAALIQGEPRIQNFWDADNDAAKVIGKMLFPQLKDAVAWDVYLLYAPRIKWEIEGTPPDPAFWMHQLASGSEDLLLDYSRLGEEAKFLLDAEDPDLEDRGITEVLQTKKKEARK